MGEKRARRNYSEDFKNQMVQLYNAGKPRAQIIREYDLTSKIFKAEFVRGRNFSNLNSLKLELSDYVHWFNHFRLHSSLGYLRPVAFKAKSLTELSD